MVLNGFGLIGSDSFSLKTEKNLVNPEIAAVRTSWRMQSTTFPRWLDGLGGCNAGGWQLLDAVKKIEDLLWQFDITFDLTTKTWVGTWDLRIEALFGSPDQPAGAVSGVWSWWGVGVGFIKTGTCVCHFAPVCIHMPFHRVNCASQWFRTSVKVVALWWTAPSFQWLATQGALDVPAPMMEPAMAWKPHVTCWCQGTESGDLFRNGWSRLTSDSLVSAAPCWKRSLLWFLQVSCVWSFVV